MPQRCFGEEGIGSSRSCYDRDAIDRISIYPAASTAADGKEVQELAEFRFLLRRFLAFSEQAAESFGLPAQQHQLLLQIAGAPQGAEVTPTYLAGRLSLRRHSVVELCNRCVAAGLLQRQDLPSDGRSVTLHLTSRGDEVLAKLSRAHTEELRELGPELVQSLQRLLRTEAPR